MIMCVVYLGAHTITLQTLAVIRRRDPFSTRSQMFPLISVSIKHRVHAIDFQLELYLNSRP